MAFRRANQQKISEVLDEWVREHAWSVKATESRIRLAYAEIFGPTIVGLTDQIRYEMGGRLRIKTASAALRNELAYSKESVRERINSALGKDLVKEVVVG